MTKLETVSEVNAPVAAVWAVPTDSSHTPKLYPNILTSTVDPPGPTVVGQKLHLVGRAGRRKLEIFAETTELVKEKKIVGRNRPGGIFKSFNSTILLVTKGKSTTVRSRFEYELNMGYLGKVFNMVLMERLVMDNLKAYSQNLKEISELIPVPE